MADFHEQMQQRYLVWYECSAGGRFSIDVDSTLRRAKWNRDLFIRDGHPARILKLTIENGEPVACWVDEEDCDD